MTTSRSTVESRIVLLDQVVPLHEYRTILCHHRSRISIALPWLTFVRISTSFHLSSNPRRIANEHNEDCSISTQNQHIPVTFTHGCGDTYAAVDPKTSALLAFVKSPTTQAKRHVNNTIIPKIRLLLLLDTMYRQDIAPIRRMALSRIDMTRPTRWIFRSGK